MHQPPHPDETRYDPYDKRSLHNLEPSSARRELLGISDKIRSTEASLERELRKIGKSTGGDLRDVSINVNEMRRQNPGMGVFARRAHTHQQNLITHYRDWADACKRHYKEVNTNSEKTQHS